MINLRYHIVSITAVFLALGIGLVFGAAFIDRATVDVLDRNLEAIEGQNDDLQAENERLRERVAAADQADQELQEQGLDQFVDGHLEGVPTVVLAVEGVDEASVAATADALDAAGAELGGTLWLTDRLLLDDEGEIADLADALQLGVEDPDRLKASLARRLGTMFADAAAAPEEVAEPGTDVPADGEVPVDPNAPVDPNTPVDPEGTEDPIEDPETDDADAEPTPEPDLLAALRAAEFIELDAPQEAPEGFAVLPSSGLRLVVVSGPGAVLPDEEIVVPLIDHITQDTVPQVGGPVVVAAQRGPDADAEATDEFDPDAERVRFVGPLRETEGLRERLSTVDDLERFSGLAAVVLALQHGGVGQFGHHGVGAGTQGLLPPDPSADSG